VKRSLLFALVLIAPFVLHAQAADSDSRNKAFDPGSNVFGIGTGIQPARVYDGSSYSAALILSYDHVTINMLGPGSLNVGVEFGIYRGEHRGSWLRSDWYKTGIAARCSYHLSLLFDNRFDPYAGVALGLYSAPEEENRYPYYTDRYKSAVFLAPFIGAKFNFAQHMGIWAEGGYDITNLKVGFNFNF
jgi:hypothetical protein